MSWGRDGTYRSVKAMADRSGNLYIGGEMDRLRILSAAATLDDFTVELLVSLSGGETRAVEEAVAELLRQGRIHPSEPARSQAAPGSLRFVWTVGGAMAVRAEVETARPQDRPDTKSADGTEIEQYEDPFDAALDMARNWVEDAEGSSDEKTLDRNLSMAGAEVRALRRFLQGRPGSNVEEIEELTRRVDLLASRAPVEAFRSRIRRSVFDALRDAAQYVPLENRTVGAVGTSPDMAFVFNATRSASDTADEVGKTVEQIGGTCVILQIADVPSSRRRQAFEALSGFFTGPGSAKTKVFIIIDSGGDVKSKTVLKELVAFFGSSERLTGSLARISDGRTVDAGWACEPTLFLSANATPADDWLPRGLLKYMILQTYLGHAAAKTSPDLARVALNDPVVFDCVSTGIVRSRSANTRFAYHRVEMDYDYGAVIRGLVRGSFAGTMANADSREAAKEVRLLTSGL